MNVKVLSLRELVLAYVCMCGEVKYEYLADWLKKEGYSKGYVKKTLSNLYTEKVIRKSDINGEDYLGLSYPIGDRRANDISEELYYHYLLMSKGGRYSGKPSRDRRRKEYADAVFEFVKAGIAADHIQVERSDQRGEAAFGPFAFETCFEKGGALLDAGDILSRIEEGRPSFFTKLCIKDLSGVHSRSELSRISGVLSGRGASFAVYSLRNDPVFFWNANCEAALTGRLKRELPDSAMKGLFFTDDPTSFYFERSRMSRNRMHQVKTCMPLRVFEDAYLLKLGESETLLKLISLGLEYEYRRSFTCRHSGICLLTSSLALTEKAKEAVKKKREERIYVPASQRDGMKAYLGLGKERPEDILIGIEDEMIKEDMKRFLEEHKDDV